MQQHLENFKPRNPYMHDDINAYTEKWQQVTAIKPLNRHNLIKKGQLTFTGNVYSFYHKIHNIGLQYGVYTKKLQDICYGLSICPNSYNAHIFTDLQYQEMAAVLYEKLADPMVIPAAHTKYRHITDHYAEENDGYAVPYEILEDNHPMMHKDPVIKASPPTVCIISKPSQQ